MTDRLLLRPLDPGDARAVHRVFSDPSVMRHIPGGATDVSRSAARSQSLIDHQHTHGFSKWAVVTRGGREVIGDCGFQYLEGGPEIELGFHIARRHWGHGYATEAAPAWLSWANVHRREPAVAIVAPDNTRSIRVLEKIGMRYTRAGTHFGRAWDVWTPADGSPAADTPVTRRRAATVEPAKNVVDTAMHTTINSLRDLAAAVRDRRQQLRLSQAEVANRARVSRAWLNEFEASKPTAELGLVIRLLDALGLRLAVDDGDRTSDDRPDPATAVDLDALLDDHRAQ